MSRPPRVSVIVPLFNGAAQLPDLFADLAAQDFRDFELVIADDASTDGSLDVARELAKTAAFPVTLLHAQRNGGPAAARNMALTAARGALIAFFDVDDRWRPAKLARQVERFDADPQLTIVGTQGDVRLADGTYCYPIIDDWVFESPRPAACLFWDSFLQTSAVMLRKEALPPGGFDEKLHIGEDRDLFIRVAAAGKLGLIRDNLVEYRRFPESQMSRKAVERSGDTVRMIRRNVGRFGDQLSWRERRRAIGKALYDAGQALGSGPHPRFAALRYLGGAAVRGFRPLRSGKTALRLLLRQASTGRGAGP